MPPSPEELFLQLESVVYEARDNFPNIEVRRRGSSCGFPCDCQIEELQAFRAKLPKLLPMVLRRGHWHRIRPLARLLVAYWSGRLIHWLQVGKAQKALD
jgi:hypothetical protein